MTFLVLTCCRECCRWEGFKVHSQGTIQGIFLTGWEGEIHAFVGCTYPLEREFLSPHLLLFDGARGLRFVCQKKNGAQLDTGSLG